LRFLADESCDFSVVVALRAAGHDVSSVIEIQPGAEDSQVLALSRSESPVLLTEDKDFGVLAYAGGHETAGVILIRFPGDARRSVGRSVVDAVTAFGAHLSKAFVVVEPGRARLSRPSVQ
jgi:predicted nuclease of predicted toxin-antitoxin system